MLRTHGRVASCQPAAALSVSCLVAVCLSFTHSTHSFARLPSPSPSPVPLSLSLSLSASHSLSRISFSDPPISAPLTPPLHSPPRDFFRDCRCKSVGRARLRRASACENIFSTAMATATLAGIPDARCRSPLSGCALTNSFVRRRVGEGREERG